MPERITERRIVDVLISHLRKSGFSVAREVPHYEKRIDVGTICSNRDEVWAIEAKTKNWPRAIGQAVVNLAAAERSYVAIYSKNVNRIPVGQLERHGLGLISVGTKWGDVEILNEARISPYTNRLAMARVKRRIIEEAG